MHVVVDSDDDDFEKPPTSVSHKNLQLVERLLNAMKIAAFKSKRNSLRDYALKTYKIDKLPGELSVSGSVFGRELSKFQRLHKNGDELK